MKSYKIKERVETLPNNKEDQPSTNKEDKDERG
jgi:hypothetical protein